jgi:hypothetical protein
MVQADNTTLSAVISGPTSGRHPRRNELSGSRRAPVRRTSRRGDCLARRSCFTCNSACRSRRWRPVRRRLSRVPPTVDVSRETRRGRWRMGQKARGSHRMFTRAGTRPRTPARHQRCRLSVQSHGGRTQTRSSVALPSFWRRPAETSATTHQHGSTWPNSWGKDLLMVRRSTPHVDTTPITRGGDVV